MTTYLKNEKSAMLEMNIALFLAPFLPLRETKELINVGISTNYSAATG